MQLSVLHYESIHCEYKKATQRALPHALYVGLHATQHYRLTLPMASGQSGLFSRQKHGQKKLVRKTTCLAR